MLLLGYLKVGFEWFFKILQNIFQGAARNDLDSTTLNSELLQLGTPKEHSSAIARVYKEQSSSLKQAMRSQSMRMSRLGTISKQDHAFYYFWLIDLETASDMFWRWFFSWSWHSGCYDERWRGKGSTISAPLSRLSTKWLRETIKKVENLKQNY